MKKFIERFRTELLLGVALLVPILAPSRSTLRPLAATLLSVLPAAGADVPAEGADEGTWREAYLRVVRENAELRSRLLALGEPAKLVPLDTAYWARMPLRIEASVLAHDSSPWRGSVVISAGTREGVREGLPVVVGNRLVGLVAEAGALTSRVRLLTDPGCRVWAEVLFGERTAEGLLAGTGGDRLEMERVPSEGATAGGPVFTGAGGGDVPRGLYVGTATSVADVDRNGVAEVEVTPAIAPAGLRIVNVLAPQK